MSDAGVGEKYDLVTVWYLLNISSNATVMSLPSASPLRWISRATNVIHDLPLIECFQYLVRSCILASILSSVTPMGLMM